MAIEAGAQLQQQWRTSTSRFLPGPPNSPPFTLQSYDEGALFSSIYAQTRWSSGSRLTITPGAARSMVADP